MTQRNLFFLILSACGTVSFCLLLAVSTLSFVGLTRTPQPYPGIVIHALQLSLDGLGMVLAVLPQVVAALGDLTATDLPLIFLVVIPWASLAAGIVFIIDWFRRRRISSLVAANISIGTWIYVSFLFQFIVSQME